MRDKDKMAVYKHPSQLRAYLSMSWYVLLSMVRNKSTLIFSFAFPLAFIAVFGLVGNSTTTVNLGIPLTVNKNIPVIEAIKNIKTIAVKTDSKSNLDKLLIQGKISAELNVQTAPSGKQLVILTTSSGDPAGASEATSIFQGIVDKLNLSLAGVTNPPIILKGQQISGRQYRYIDFVLPGMLGFSLLSTALFGTVFGFIALKKQLVLKRMFATPVRAITILLSQGTSRLILALFQATIIVGAGVFIFNFYLPHGLETLLEIFLLSILGLITFMGFGLFISGFAQDENSAGPLTNLVSLPQFLLSGVFFSTDNFPIWLQHIANNLPLTYFNQAVRKITTEGGTLADAWTYVLGLAVWGIVMYLLSSRTFKWE